MPPVRKKTKSSVPKSLKKTAGKTLRRSARKKKPKKRILQSPTHSPFAPVPKKRKRNK